MDDRRTLRSGLPVELRRELEGLVGALLAVAKTEGVPGRLRVERLLGHGALFVTFAATRIDRRGAMPVALKVLRPSIALAWPEGPRILSREQARLVAILNERVPPSPHVVRLLEAGELGREPSRGLDLEVPYLTLELVPAPIDVADASLFTRVRLEVTTHGFALDAKTALGVLRGVAKGLDLVHGHGLLHRGLGPTNVLMVGDVARVSDLAIARPSGLPPGFGILTDTPAHVPDAYRAPEQRNGAAPTPAVDVFAFAALARFVLTGRPGQALVTANTLHPSLANPERRAALVALEAALDLGLAADPEQRPATIESFFRTLEPALETLARGVRVVRAPTPQPALAGWVWTVRHEPRAKLAGVMRAVVDEEGRALLLAREPAASSERATDGLDVTAPENRSAHFFDGRLYRPVPPIPELDTAVVATHHDGAWVVFGRGTDGRGAAARLEAGAQRAPPGRAPPSALRSSIIASPSSTATGASSSTASPSPRSRASPAPTRSPSSTTSSPSWSAWPQMAGPISRRSTSAPTRCRPSPGRPGPSASAWRATDAAARCWSAAPTASWSICAARPACASSPPRPSCPSARTCRASPSTPRARPGSACAAPPGCAPARASRSCWHTPTRPWTTSSPSRPARGAASSSRGAGPYSRAGICCPRACRVRAPVSPRLRVVLVFLASLVLACATGCRRRYVVRKQDPAVREGRALFVRYCALCHGKKAEGYAADHANALGNRDFLAIASDEFLRQSITHGRPGTPMSPWGNEHGGPLGPQQVDQIVAYLRSFARKPFVKTAGVTKSRQRRPRSRRDRLRRRAAGRATASRGEGTNRATSVSHPNFLHNVSDGFLRHTITNGRAGTDMEGFAKPLTGTPLTAQTIDDLVAHIRTLEGIPGPLPPVNYEPPPGLDQLVLNPTSTPPKFTLRDGRFVPAAQVEQALRDKKKIVLLDARATPDWSRSHIVGALPFPFYDIEKMASSLPNDGTWIVAYCACPHAASGHVVDELRRRKFPATAVIDEGIGFWTLKGYPVAQAAQLKIP